MQFGAMQALVGRRLAEQTGRTFWSAADIATAINDGYLEVSDATEWQEQYFEIDLLNNRPYYDLRTVIGPSFLAIRPAWNEQTSQWLLPTSVRQFDSHDRRWEMVTGTPQRILLRGLWWLGYWPRVQADVGTVKQYYVALPTRLIEDTDEPGFPEPFHDACVEYALSDLHAQDGETALAVSWWSQYLATETRLRTWVADRAMVPMLMGYGEAQWIGIAR